MGSIFKNKLVLIGIILVILLLGGGGFFVLSKSQKQSSNVSQPTPTPEIVNTVKAEDIGFSASAAADKKSVNMTLAKLDGIASVDYEVDYNAAGNIPRGVIGSIEVKPTDTTITRNILLGTCSSGTCKYDKGVTKVTFVVSITYSNGNSGTLKQSIDL